MMRTVASLLLAATVLSSASANTSIGRLSQNSYGYTTPKSAALKVRGGGPVGDFISTYDGWVSEKPILTKACTSMVGFALGDLLAQVRATLSTARLRPRPAAAPRCARALRAPWRLQRPLPRCHRVPVAAEKHASARGALWAGGRDPSTPLRGGGRCRALQVGRLADTPHPSPSLSRGDNTFLLRPHSSRSRRSRSST